ESGSVIDVDVINTDSGDLYQCFSRFRPWIVDVSVCQDLRAAGLGYFNSFHRLTFDVFLSPYSISWEVVRKWGSWICSLPTAHASPHSPIRATVLQAAGMSG